MAARDGESPGAGRGGIPRVRFRTTIRAFRPGVNAEIAREIAAQSVAGPLSPG